MLEINAAFGQESQNLGLVGRTGENAYRRIMFDCEAVLGEFPGAGIVCALRRACDAEAYAKELTAEGKKRLLTLSAADVAAPGSLMIELRAVEADAIRKSAVYVGRIERGLSGQGDAPGNPVADTINNLEARAKAASAAAAAAQAVADEVRRKLEAGELNGSDAEVTAENIKSALGYAPVRDVYVGESSVLADGVANVPVAQTWVTGEKQLGVMAPSIVHGLYAVNGIIQVYPAESANIANRSSDRPIVPPNLDYAVTAALTDGKGPAWTAAQQAAARERMGIPGDYELIEEITISEAVTSFIRESTPDGTPYSLTGFFCVITSPGVDNAIVLNQQIYAGETSLYNYGVRAVEAAVNAKSVLFACVNNKILHGEQYPVGALYEFANVIRLAKKFVPDGSPITKIVFSGNIPANTKITIYGVRV